MTVADSLAAWGIVRAPEVVELAASAGLDLACGATMLEKESGGGRSVWGSDGVDPGGTYVKGSVVTQAAYLAYQAKRRAGLISAQGVGPTQLTNSTLQAAADAIGGCWDWRCNVLTGFRHLAQLQRAYGVRDGFRRYNGGGPAAEAYAADSMARLAHWQTRLGPLPPPGPAAPLPAPVPIPAAPLKEDEPMAPVPLPIRADGRFYAAVMVEVGSSSLVVDRAWITYGSCWGSTHFKVTALDGSGTVIPGQQEVDMPNNRRGVFEVPSGAVMVTVEGHTLGAASVPAAALITQPK